MFQINQKKNYAHLYAETSVKLIFVFSMQDVQEYGDLKQLEYTGDPCDLVEPVDAQKLKLSR